MNETTITRELVPESQRLSITAELFGTHVSALKSAPVFRPRQRPDFALVSQVNRRGPWARRSMRRR